MRSSEPPDSGDGAAWGRVRFALERKKFSDWAEEMKRTAGWAANQTSNGPRSEDRRLLRHTEAPVGIEPTMEVLQTSALPLGYGARGQIS